MIAIKHETRFRRLGTPATPSDTGRSQFFQWQSRGVYPENPDPYFICLETGKKWWDFTVTEWRRLRFSPEWPGWNQVMRDFRHDPEGLAWIFPDSAVIPR